MLSQPCNTLKVLLSLQQKLIPITFLGNGLNIRLPRIQLINPDDASTMQLLNPVSGSKYPITDHSIIKLNWHDLTSNEKNHLPLMFYVKPDTNLDTRYYVFRTTTDICRLLNGLGNDLHHVENNQYYPVITHNSNGFNNNRWSGLIQRSYTFVGSNGRVRLAFYPMTSMTENLDVLILGHGKPRPPSLKGVSTISVPQ
jgi:hypothetical protein